MREGGCEDRGSSECFSERTPDLGGHLLYGNEAFKVSFGSTDFKNSIVYKKGTKFSYAVSVSMLVTSFGTVIRNLIAV